MSHLRFRLYFFLDYHVTASVPSIKRVCESRSTGKPPFTAEDGGGLTTAIFRSVSKVRQSHFLLATANLSQRAAKVAKDHVPGQVSLSVNVSVPTRLERTGGVLPSRSEWEGPRQNCHR